MIGKMKKHLMLLIVGVSLILLMAAAAACAEPAPAPAPTPAPTPTPSPAPAPAPAPPKPITLVFSSHDPKEGSWSETYQPFFDAVEARTNGGIIIEDHWSAELVGFIESYDACRAGDVDMVHFLPTLFPNYFPMEDVQALTKFDVKCLARSQQATELHALFPEMDQAYTDSGTKLLFKTGTFPNYSCMTEGNAIRSFDDFKGKKYLTTGKWDSEYWVALGMTPVSLMPEESYSALQTGVVDGCTLTMPSLFDFGWGEVATEICETNVRPAIWSCAMNLDTWNSLPAEYQKIIMEESAKIPAIQDAIQLRLDQELIQAAIDQFGSIFITLPPEELAKCNEATESVRAAFVAEMNALGLPGQELLDKSLELEQKYSGPEYALK